MYMYSEYSEWASYRFGEGVGNDGLEEGEDSCSGHLPSGLDVIQNLKPD